MRNTQIPLFTPETEWVMPEELKNLKGAKEIAIDLETKTSPIIIGDESAEKPITQHTIAAVAERKTNKSSGML